ncbi:hypothetical protein LXA43DRAFT_1066101 [Ganoderma leucocontextum]|nr:hypothetical protein LXA43DRAFT_1066101 [Ganoderma leucocontextum]
MKTCTMDRNTLQTLNRAGLQRLAKEKGISAVGPNEQMRTRLLLLLKGDSSASDGPSGTKEGGSEVFKDVKNSLARGGERPGPSDGIRHSKRLAAIANKTPPANENEKLQRHRTKGSGSLKKENTVVGTPTQSSNELCQCQAVAGLLALQVIQSTVIPRPEQPSTAALGHKRKADPELEEGLPSSVPKPSQKRRRKTRRS